MYCAILFQIITYWYPGYVPKIDVMLKEESTAALHAVEDLNYVSAKYGHEVQTWAVSLKECEPIPAKDQYRDLTYWVEALEDGRVCWNGGSK
jgi:hypothetical protein